MCTGSTSVQAHHALAEVVCQDARHLPDHRRLAHARAPQEQHRVGHCTAHIPPSASVLHVPQARSCSVQSQNCPRTPSPAIVYRPGCHGSCLHKPSCGLPSRMSRIMSTWPVTALPTRHVRPTTVPFLLRMALMRCRVPCTPALLSLPKSPTACSAAFRSSQVICTAHRDDR